MDNEQQKRIMKGVFDKINAGEVHMRPRIYFTIKVVVVAAVAILSLVASSLLISFIIFSLKASGQLFLLGFGSQGILLFFKFFPWILLVIVCVLLIVLEKLMKRFAFGYRRSFARMLGLIVLISLIIGYLISTTPFHELLMKREKEKRLPVFGGMYEGRRPMPEQGMFRGDVRAINGSIFILHEEDAPEDDRHLIFAPPGVVLTDFMKIGDEVFVATVLVRNELHAIGIKKLPALAPTQNASSSPR